MGAADKRERENGSALRGSGFQFQLALNLCASGLSLDLHFLVDKITLMPCLALSFSGPVSLIIIEIWAVPVTASALGSAVCWMLFVSRHSKLAS